MKKRHHALWRLATVDGVPVSAGYRSGRSRWRETPETASTAKTRSAGTRPAAIQPEIVPCDRRPRARANADCPRTASQASKSASFDMSRFNAQTVNRVNAYSANPEVHIRGMGRPTESEPSEFWKRLVQCWSARNLPTTQNGIARKLTMSQGSVRRWFAGEGFPETETLIEVARLGRVSIDWLLTGKHHPSGVDKDLDELLDLWEHLDGPAREHVVRSARGEAALIPATTRRSASDNR